MKKVLSLIAIVAMIAMFSLSASAISVSYTESGDKVIVSIIADEDGSIDGTFEFGASGAVDFNRVRNGEALLVANPDTGLVAVAGAEVGAGEVIGTIEFDIINEGDFTITIEGTGGDFAAVSENISDEIVFEDVVAPPAATTAAPPAATTAAPPAATTTVTVAPPPVDSHPVVGVGFAIVPALIAGAAVAIARKRK